MEIGSLIQAHGYWVLVIGCLLEGETVLAMAGFAARMGHLELSWVIALAAAAGFAGDQFYFWLGRRHGPALLARFASIAEHTERVHSLVDEYQIWLIVGIRFLYGLRVAGPIIIGTSPVSALRFAFFNAIGAILWAALIAGLGWFVGQAIELVFHEFRRYELWILLLFAAIGGLGWCARRAVWRNQSPRSGSQVD